MRENAFSYTYKHKILSSCEKLTIIALIVFYLNQNIQVLHIILKILSELKMLIPKKHRFIEKGK